MCFWNRMFNLPKGTPSRNGLQNCAKLFKRYAAAAVSVDDADKAVRHCCVVHVGPSALTLRAEGFVVFLPCLPRTVPSVPDISKCWRRTLGRRELNNQS